MEAIALGARVLLAMIFVTAALGKLTDQQGTRRALADFGMPARTLVSGGLLLPLAELAAAVALLLQSAARVGAAAAASLLIAFSVAIGAAMRRGEAPDCHCFGQLHSAPAGRGTVVRNTTLLVPALLVAVYGPGDAIDSWLSARSGSELMAVAAIIAALLLVAASAQLWRRNRALNTELERARQSLAAFPPGLPIGAPAPRFVLPDVEGRTVSLEQLLERHKPVALVFVSPTCAPCVSMLADLARWQRTLTGSITIAIVVAGSLDGARDVSAQYGLVNVLVQDDAEVFEAYRAAASPAVVIVAPDGTIGSATKSSHAIVEAVIRRELVQRADRSERGAATIGEESIALRQ